MIFLLGAVVFFALQTAATKVYQSNTVLNRFFTSTFLVGIGTTSLLFFLIVTGFQPEINSTSILLAIIYAIAFVACQYGYIGAIENGKMAIATMFMMSGAIVIPFVWGALCFGEEVNSYKVIGIVLMLLSLLPTLFGDKSKSKANLKFVLNVLLVFIGNGVVSVIVAVQAKGQAAVGAPDFMIQGTFFYLIMGIIGALIFGKRNPSLKEDLHRLNNKKIYLSVVGLALANGLGNVCSLVAARNVDSTIQFPVMNGGVLLLSGLFSWLIFKEKLSKRDLISFVLIIISILIFGIA